MDSIIINGQYLINPDRNEINEMKVEPRLIKLLCLLMENKGNLVSRTYIIETVWNGYGGGNEGLTQAISFLRKLFNDTDKTIIETISKSGYIFNGAIEKKKPVSQPLVTPVRKEQVISKFMVAAASVIFLVILFGYVSNKGKDSESITSKSVNKYHNSRHDSIHNLKHEAWLKSQIK